MGIDFNSMVYCLNCLVVLNNFVRDDIPKSSAQHRIRKPVSPAIHSLKSNRSSQKIGGYLDLPVIILLCNNRHHREDF